PSRIEELAPRILASDDAIGGHHPGERAERQPVAGESRAGELPLGGLADVRQTVRRFDHLARPAMRDVDATVHRSKSAPETIDARLIEWPFSSSDSGSSPNSSTDVFSKIIAPRSASTRAIPERYLRG